MTELEKRVHNLAVEMQELERLLLHSGLHPNINFEPMAGSALVDVQDGNYERALAKCRGDWEPNE